MGSEHRISLISDLHGNEIALRGVLESIAKRGTDEIVCLGDVATLGVAPREVIDTLQRLGCRCIMGNHDDYLLDAALVAAHTSDAMITQAIDWCRDLLSADQIEFVRRFEEGFELPLGDGHTLQLFHGSPSSNLVSLLAQTPPDTFDRELGPERATVMAGGHTHVQMLRQHRGTLVVNPGSVGAPFKEAFSGGAPTVMTHAEYATVCFRDGDVSVDLHRVALDRTALVEAARGAAGPIRSVLLRDLSRLPV